MSPALVIDIANEVEFGHVPSPGLLTLYNHYTQRNAELILGRVYEGAARNS
jgi:hypothetical protein